MSIIKINCTDQVLSFQEMPVISSGDVNNDQVQFTFDNTWDGMAITAVFYQQGGGHYFSLLDENNACTIPAEAISSRGITCLGVIGVNGSVRKTSNVLRYEIVEGAYTEAPAPSPDAYAQMLNAFTATMEECQTVIDSAAYLDIKNENEFEYDDSVFNQKVTAIITQQALPILPPAGVSENGSFNDFLEPGIFDLSGLHLTSSPFGEGYRDAVYGILRVMAYSVSNGVTKFIQFFITEQGLYRRIVATTPWHDLRFESWEVLHYSATIPPNANIDDYVTDGKYYCPTGGGLIFGPTYTMTVETVGSYVRQTIQNMSQELTFVRTRRGKVWGKLYKISYEEVTD